MRAEEIFDLVTEACMNMNAGQTSRLIEERKIAGSSLSLQKNLAKTKRPSRMYIYKIRQLFKFCVDRVTISVSWAARFNKKSRWSDRMWQSNQPNLYTRTISFNSFANYLNKFILEEKIKNEPHGLDSRIRHKGLRPQDYKFIKKKLYKLFDKARVAEQGIRRLPFEQVASPRRTRVRMRVLPRIPSRASTMRRPLKPLHSHECRYEISACKSEVPSPGVNIEPEYFGRACLKNRVAGTAIDESVKFNPLGYFFSMNDGMVRNKKVPRGHYRIAFTTLPVSLLSLIKYISKRPFQSHAGSNDFSAALTPSSVTTVVEADAQAMGESYAGFKFNLFLEFLSRNHSSVTRVIPDTSVYGRLVGAAWVIFYEFLERFAHFRVRC